jgi:membrane protease YdiL (CAAX protease family)
VKLTDRHAAAILFGILIVAGALTAPLTLRSRLVVLEIVSSGLLVYVARRWTSRLPWRRSPAYRLIVITVALFVLGLLIAGQFQRLGIGGIQLSTGNTKDALYAALIGLFAIPAALFTEMFFRGVLYSVFEESGGSGWAVVGSSAATVLAAVPVVGLAWIWLAYVLTQSLLLAASRRQTDSLLPAVIYQGTSGLLAALFAIVAALSSHFTHG